MHPSSFFVRDRVAPFPIRNQSFESYRLMFFMCQLSQRCIIVPSLCSLGVLLTPLSLTFSPSSLRLCNCTIQWFSRHCRLPCSNLCHCHWGFVSTIEIDICINVRLLGLQTSFDDILYDLLSRPSSILLRYSFSMHHVMYKWWTNSLLMLATIASVSKINLRVTSMLLPASSVRVLY